MGRPWKGVSGTALDADISVKADRAKQTLLNSACSAGITIHSEQDQQAGPARNRSTSLVVLQNQSKEPDWKSRKK